ncbi:hypothetical protein MTP99_011459 [Tenebrio molitor]|jgi:cytochrome b involved in lipid metabolism|uniref:Cytochrome b5 n=1 Tax=Tenebrio molitor TaxID=7067 RepID=A0A8J6LC66_TENMO|nr:hypothetical protein GEV33_005958 [Tenebrio molitor]KAJ3630252.1 hypothetical protein MTP99_011455 [Tenebrio molitor]KAJ3630256.1 hypothetical protein MTP99_011459 [Tenebrio molitor]CAH1369959.1 unnamed protein product [Tenebrio molitor]
METKFYSLEEVAKNDGKGGNRTWIVVKDSVYDVTDYLQQEEEHPGGNELIIEWAGKECTRPFDDAGHSSEAKKEMKQYKIGELREEDRKQKQQKKSGDAAAQAKNKENRRSCCSYLTCGLCD